MVTKSLWVAGSVLALVALLAVDAQACATCGCQGVAGSKTKTAAVEKAPGFTLENTEGEEVSLSDYEGKIVVLEWVNWDCPFAKRHLKNGTETALHKEFGDDGVAFLFINSTNYHDNARNKKEKAKYGVPFPVLNDQSGKTGRAYGAKTTPDIRIIHKNGVVVYQGAMDNDPRGRKPEGETVNYVEKALTELLAGKDVSTAKTRPYGCSVKYAK
jgi:peroxiredoxin